MLLGGEVCIIIGVFQEEKKGKKNAPEPLVRGAHEAG